MTTREEKVRLSLEDNFTKQMIAAAGATALLKKELGGLSGTSVETSRETEKLKDSVKDVGTEAEKTGAKVRQGANDIDRYSGRLRLLTEAAVTLGPALVPIGAVGVPAVMALAAGLGAAAGAAGVALIAFHGIGDGLKALDAYQLDPSTAHLKKMREEFEKLGPAGVAMVKFLDDLEPQLKDLQTVTRAGLFPGVEAGITSLLTMLPEVRVLLFNLSTELGHLTAEAGKALSGDGAKAFFDYLETDAAPTMAAFAHTLGNLAAGFGSLMVAFSPLSRDFASGMEAMSSSFAKWAAGLSETDGFRSFVAYVRESGPQVLALLGALATAFIDIARAAAPVGAAVLPALTALARVLSLIAESPIGPPLFTAAAAMLVLNRATILASAGLNKFKVSAEGATAAGQKFGAGVSFAAIITGIGLVNAAFNKLDERVDTANLARNIEAFANGQNVDNLNNIGQSLADAGSHMARFNDLAGAFLTLNQDDSTWEKAKEDISNVDQALAALVESGRTKEAAAAFARITKQADEQGVSLDDVKAAFSAYQTALSNVPPASDAAAASARKLAQAHNRQAATADKAAASTAGLVGAMQDEADAALKAFDAETQYRQALKDAQAQAKKNEAGIRGNTDAVLNNRGALSSLASAWNNQSNAVKNNVGRYKEARQAFLDVADGMHVPIATAKALADRLLQIPKSIVIRQQNNMDPAVKTAKLLAQAIRNIPTSWLTQYTINTVRTGTDPELHAPRANGGEIFGQRHPYGDKVLAMLAPGEEVISNRHGQADRYRADRASGRIPRYAEGGQVGGAPTNFAAWQAFQHRDPFAGLGDAAHAAGINLDAFNKIGLKELKQRDRFLNWQEKQAEKAEKQAEKELSVQRDRLAEEKSQLQELKDARKQFAESVSANFKSDIFGNTDLAAAGQSGLLGSGFGNQVYLFAQQQMAAEEAKARAEAAKSGKTYTPGDPQAFSMADWVQKYLDTLSQQQLAGLRVTANTGQLNLDTAQAGTFTDLLTKLRHMGLKGGAYRDLAASGDVAQAQAYANLSPSAIKRLVQDYQERSLANKRLENVVGTAEFGKRINQQTKAVEQQSRLTHQMAGHVREMKDGIREQTRLAHLVEQRVGELVKAEQKRKEEAHKLAVATGTEVGKALNNAAANSKRTP